MNNEFIDLKDKYESLLEELPSLLSKTGKETLINIISQAKQLVKAEHVHIRVINKVDKKLEILQYPESDEITKNTCFSSINEDEAIGGMVFKDGRSAIVNDIHSKFSDDNKKYRTNFAVYLQSIEKKDPELFQKLNQFKHCLVVPLFISQKVNYMEDPPLKKPIGVLTAVKYESELGFSEDDKLIIEHFAAQASIALRNAWLFEAATWKPSESGHFVIETLCKEVVNKAINITVSMDGKVRFVNWDGKSLVPSFSMSDDLEQIVRIRKIGMCPAGIAAKNKEPYQTNDLINDIHFKTFKTFTSEYEKSYKNQLEKLKELNQDINSTNEFTSKFKDKLNKLMKKTPLFKWEEISECDNTNLAFFLEKLGIELTGLCVKRIKSDVDNIIQVSIEEHLFDWNNCDDKFEDFLKKTYGFNHIDLTQIKQEEYLITLTTNGKTIKLRLNDEKSKIYLTIDGNGPDIYFTEDKIQIFEKKYLSLRYDTNEKRIYLEIDNGKTSEFIVDNTACIFKVDDPGIYERCLLLSELLDIDKLKKSISNQIKAVTAISKAWEKYNKELEKWKSEVAVPILIGNDLLGVLNVHSDQENQYFESDVAILQALANRVAASLMIHQQDVLKKINDIEQRIAISSIDIAKELSEGIKEVTFLTQNKNDIFPLLYTCYLRPKREIKDFEKKFIFEESKGASDDEKQLGKTPIRPKGLGFQAIQELSKKQKLDESVFIVRENIDDPINRGSETANNKGILTTACLPLVFQDDVYGLLYIHVRNNRYFFTDIERKTLTFFANHAAIELKNKRTSENKTYDELCGTYLIEQCAVKRKAKS